MGIWRFYGGRSFTQDGRFVENPEWILSVLSDCDRVVHLRPQDIILPGFADFHVHLASPANSLGVLPRQLLATGVLVAGDAGTEGWRTVSRAATSEGLRIKRWLSLLPDGLSRYPMVTRFSGLTDDDWIHWQSLMKERRTEILGVKIRLGQIDEADDVQLLTQGLDLARTLNLPLMVHVTGAWINPVTVLNALRPGDVVTHVYHGRRGTLADGPNVMEALTAAIHKGVWLDLGHGANHFSWRSFRRLTAHQVLPDTISTDMTQRTWGKAPVYDMAHLCSKLWAGGLSWTAIYRAVLTSPLKYLGLSLPADSAVVLRYRSEPVEYPDTEGEVVVATGGWRPQYIIAHGHVVMAREGL